METVLVEKKNINEDVELLKQKDIEIQEISVQREERFLVEIYMEKSNIVSPLGPIPSSCFNPPYLFPIVAASTIKVIAI